MKIQMVLEGAFVLIGVAFIITQVVIPGWHNRPLLPFFRRAPREAEGKLVDAYEQRTVKETLRRADEILGVQTPPPSSTAKKRGTR